MAPINHYLSECAFSPFSPIVDPTWPNTGERQSTDERGATEALGTKTTHFQMEKEEISQGTIGEKENT